MIGHSVWRVVRWANCGLAPYPYLPPMEDAKSLAVGADEAPLDAAIFVDLDDFLVAWRSPLHTGSSHMVSFSRGESYTFAARPFGGYLISSLLALAPVRILTSATKEMAGAINGVCEFVAKDEVIGREDYLTPVFDAGFNTTYAVTRTGFCPMGVLLDNQPATEFQTQLKMKFLGIDSTRFVKGPVFGREVDDTLTAGLVDELVAQVKSLLGVSVGVNVDRAT